MEICTLCLDCEEQLILADGISIGNEYRCPNCYADLVVIHLNPLKLDWDSDSDDGDTSSDDDDPSGDKRNR